MNATKSGADYLKELGSEFLEDFFVSFFNEKDNATAPDEYLFVPYIKTSGIHRDYEKYILVTFSQYVRDASRYILVSADRSDRNIKVGSDKYVNARARAKGAINVLYITPSYGRTNTVPSSPKTSHPSSTAPPPPWVPAAREATPRAFTIPTLPCA